MKKHRPQPNCSTKTTSYKTRAEAIKMARYTCKYLELPEGSVWFYCCKTCKRYHLQQLDKESIEVLNRRERSSKL